MIFTTMYTGIKRYLASLILLFMVMSSCEETPPIPEEPNCYEAEVLDIDPYLGCTPVDHEEANKWYLHLIAIKGHSIHDTVYTRLREDHYALGERKIRIQVDSVQYLNVICTALSAMEHPPLWVTKLTEPCQ